MKSTKTLTTLLLDADPVELLGVFEAAAPLQCIHGPDGPPGQKVLIIKCEGPSNVGAIDRDACACCGVKRIYFNVNPDHLVAS